MALRAFPDNHLRRADRDAGMVAASSPEVARRFCCHGAVDGMLKRRKEYC
jgi:hypothetical protein